MKKFTLWGSEQTHEKLRWKNLEEYDNYPVQVVSLFWFPWFEIIFLTDCHYDFNFLFEHYILL